MRGSVVKLLPRARTAKRMFMQLNHVQRGEYRRRRLLQKQGKPA